MQFRNSRPLPTVLRKISHAPGRLRREAASLRGRVDRRLRKDFDRYSELAWERLHGVPLIKNVQIQTHSICNANCVFCPYIESWHRKHPGKMTEELFDKVLEDLSPFAMGINRGKVAPYLMQEPLLDKKIFSRIEKIYRTFPDTMVEISTNGIALNEATAEKLIDLFAHRRHQIWLSHHGIDKESMSGIMKIDYDKATRNLLNFVKRCDGRLKLQIRGAGESRGGGKLYFTRDQYVNYWRRIFENEGINMNNVHLNAFTYHDRAGTIFREERNANSNNRGVIRVIDRQHPFYCTRVDEWIHIMYDGTLRLCCMDYHAEVPLPNLNDMTVMEYLKSPEFQQVRDMVEGRRESPENFICKRCTSPGG